MSSFGIPSHGRTTAPSAAASRHWPRRSAKQFKSFANTADPLTHVVVLFVAEGRSTRVHLVHSGWRSSPEWEEARLWQERAWAGALKQLERVAAT